MDFEYAADSLARQVASAQSSLKTLELKMKSSAKKTEELLAIASEVGVTAVSIGKKHPLVGNEDWPFGASGSIFTRKEDRHDGWPAAWHIARQAGVGGGAGNSGQHQADTSNLIDGVYECRNGAWSRVDLLAEAN
jgi:hypothetical protein